MKLDFTPRSRRSNVIARNGMVATSQPLATLAGVDILRSGGNAADAAVAAAFVLNVVEPFSSGVGGDCFALYWEAASKQVYALNASGPAAQKASLKELLDLGYTSYPMWTGQAVSVPGAVGGWQALLERFGKMSISEVIQPAISYAQDGYPVSEYIAQGWSLMRNKLLRQSETDQLDTPFHQQLSGPPQPSGNEYLIKGQPPKVGEMISLPTLADTLRGIGSYGKAYIYRGNFADQLCNYVQQYGGWLEPDDLENFSPEWVTPISTGYRGYELHECPPNGQGLAAIMALKIAEGFDLAAMPEADRMHTLVECMRLGFTEALAWVSDPTFSHIPKNQLFDETYIASRRELIAQDRALAHIETGILSIGEDTTYLCAVDGEGNACSLINSLYYGGGTGLVVPGTGVLLQNRSATFSLDPSHPNALEGGKRPYQTIIPGMITHAGELFGAMGVMGGFMQPQGHLQMMVNLIDHEFYPQQALDMPRFCLAVTGGGMGAEDPGGALAIEQAMDPQIIRALIERGHKVTVVSDYDRIYFGSGQIILRDPNTGVMMGGSDAHKDGCAIGY